MAELGITLEETQLLALLAYLQLLQKWNKAYNLTAIRDPLQMVDRHLLDSLSIAPYIRVERIIDVGTGPGLPGIPLAIAFPDKSFTLLDSVGKKTRFLQQVKMELQLDNIHIHNGRVESFQPERLFDGVVSRAFSSLQLMLDLTSHLIPLEGQFLAMKGIYPTSELAALSSQFKLCESHRLQVPGIEEERHLLVLSKQPCSEEIS
jgi:16S rRNA (guanine527-N7)-methyltransferase